MPNERFTVTSKEPKLVRVQISREYLIEILKEAFSELDFPMCYVKSEWTIQPEYDPMDMSRSPKLQGIVVTRYSKEKGSLEHGISSN
tara:strand:+ start:1084 stop:1344 length:261 start_codon:yes stop_codon:yes gene_type:complete